MYWRKILGILAFSALFFASCTSVTSTGTVTTSNASFASGACPAAVKQAHISCGFLSVPEERSNAASKMIKVAVAIVQKGATPDKNPIIFLQGGPGGSAIQDFAPSIASGQFSFGNHDVILVDQRGTGYSQPSLACTEVDALQYQTNVNLTVTQSIALQDQALNACHTRLTGAGINLSGYTTYNDANDVHDLIAALHLQQVSLYGVSYGTRLALEIMRSFPQGIKSVVLDSTVPPDIRLLSSEPANTVRVFNTLFQGCANDAGCNAKYPNLSARFYQLVDKLNANPITFQTVDQSDATSNPHFNQNFTVLFNGDALMGLLFQSFYVTAVIPVLPQMISEIEQGNYTHWLTILFGVLTFQGDSVSYGVYFSVECAEDIAFVTSADLVTAAQQYPADIRNDQLAGLQSLLGECQRWQVKTVNTSESQPVTSSIPTIVLEGKYDPVTPPSNGDHVAQTLTHSAIYTFPATGHATFFNTNSTCPSSIVQAFFNDASTFPAKDCIATMTEPQFR